jgi:hypothetical protein
VRSLKPFFYFILIAIGLTYFLISPLFPNQEAVQILSALVFWYGVVYLALAFPLRRALQLVMSWKSKGLLLLSSYLLVHYVAYGLLLERILGMGGVNLFGITYSPVQSVSLSNYLVLLYSPSVAIGNGGFFLDLSFFSLVMGLMIGIVVVGTLIKLLKLKSSIKRDSWIVALPLTGVLAGGTCCVSISGIVAEYGLSALAVGGLAVIGPIDAIYFGLPFLTLASLWLLFETIKDVSSEYVSGNNQYLRKTQML